MQYSIVLYDETKHLDDLEEFCSTAKQQGIINNSSLKAIALKPDSGLFLTYHQGKIVSMAYTHNFSNYYPDAWRVCCRTATLTTHQARGYPLRPGLVSCTGLNAFTLPLQVDYARDHGAKLFLFTSNIEGAGGTKSSEKVCNHLVKLQHRDPVYEYYDTREIYHINQQVWKLNFRNIIDIEGEL